MVTPFVNDDQICELNSSVYRYFIEKELPDCNSCRFKENCSDVFYLNEAGEIKIAYNDDPRLIPQGSEIVWPKCPRSFLSKYETGFQPQYLDEVVRWEWERNTHTKRNCSNQLSELIRYWTKIKDRPKELLEYIKYKELEAKRNK